MDPIHLQKNHYNPHYHHLFLLLLPAMVFALTIAIFMHAKQVHVARNPEVISVLGESDEIDSVAK